MRNALFAAVAALLLSGAASAANARATETAIFAGGCFWCVESDFDRIPGVLETVSGYTGGTTPNPTYGQVTAGGTGHREAVRITYDPARVDYGQLLTAFWHSVDPTDPGGQFCDRGVPYQTAIFVEGDEQRRLAEASKQAAERSLGQEIVTPIEAAGPFFPAEDYHQDYYRKNPLQYRFYRWNCGRDQRVRELWGESAYKGIPGRD
jgi:peptide-methionine (S)-S-oxide reductase